MKTTNTRFAFLIIIGIILAGSVVTANPLRSSNHGFNPALLGVRSRPLVEMYLGVDAGLGNSYFSLGDILTEQILIDFNDINSRLSGSALSVGTHFSTNAHLAVSVLGVSVAPYFGVQGVVRANVPGELFKLLADGNTIDTVHTGSGDAYARLFLETGMYGGYRWRDYEFGVKIGAFAPIMYSDPATAVSYELSTDVQAGRISGSIDVNVPFYSVLDFQQLQESDNNGYNPADDLFSRINGLNFSMGAVRVQRRKAMYGVSITGITLRPAKPGYEMLLTAGADFEIENLIENNEPELTEREPEFTSSGDSDMEISTPISIGGFYRFVGFPGFIDWIAHGAFTFDNEIFLNLGVTAEGSFFPLSILSLGIEYDKILWKTTLGLRANARVAEIGVDLGLAAPELLNMWSTNGFYGKVYVALGF